MEISIVHKSDIEELLRISFTFDFLQRYQIREQSRLLWYTSNGANQHAIQTMFIGKTGYGKSTTINRIIKREVFATDDIASCTKRLYCADYKIHKYKEHYFSFCDLPGIGQSEMADTQYMEWYRGMLEKSDCVVYLIRADQRDFVRDERVFQTLFKTKEQKRKVILAINYADKIEPVNRSMPFNPSFEQMRNLQEKKRYTSDIFNIPQSEIIIRPPR